MFEATDGWVKQSHQTKRVQFERAPTNWNSPERNRKATYGNEQNERLSRGVNFFGSPAVYANPEDDK